MTRFGQQPHPILHRLALSGMCIVVPVLMGGCPDYRDDIVGIAETATHDILFGGVTGAEAADAAALSLLEATLQLAFDQYRSDASN